MANIDAILRDSAGDVEVRKFLPFLIPIITARATRMSIPIRNSASTGERKIEKVRKERERKYKRT